MTSRSYCFTHNSVNQDDLAEADFEAFMAVVGGISGMRYAVGQLEAGQSGHKHIQGYIEFDSPRSVGYLKEQCGCRDLHVEHRRGTRDQARAYCQKEESRLAGPVECGTWTAGGQGRRSDLDAFYQACKEKPEVTDMELLDTYPGTFLKYPHAADTIRRIQQGHANQRVVPRVILLVGPTGVGKSRWVREQNMDCYFKAPDEWWPDYDGKSDVCLDDFYGWLPFHMLLRLLDRYPIRVGVKGAHVYFNPSTIYITSNKIPIHWYKEDIRAKYDFNALYRRIHMIHYWFNGERAVLEDPEEIAMFCSGVHGVQF